MCERELSHAVRGESAETAEDVSAPVAGAHQRRACGRFAIGEEVVVGPPDVDVGQHGPCCLLRPCPAIVSIFCFISDLNLWIIRSRKSGNPQAEVKY